MVSRSTRLAAAGLAAGMAAVVEAGKPGSREPLEPGIPNRLSISYASPYFHGGISQMIGVEVDGVRVGNCYEYCVTEGWYKVREGKTGVSGKLHSNNIRPFWRVQPSRQVLKRLLRG